MSDTVINRPASKVKGGKGLTIERIYTNEGKSPSSASKSTTNSSSFTGKS